MISLTGGFILMWAAMANGVFLFSLVVSFMLPASTDGSEQALKPLESLLRKTRVICVVIFLLCPPAWLFLGP